MVMDTRRIFMMMAVQGEKDEEASFKHLMNSLLGNVSSAAAGFRKSEFSFGSNSNHSINSRNSSNSSHSRSTKQ